MSRWLLVSSFNVSPKSFFLFLWVISPFFRFSKLACHFYSTLMGVFERLFGLGSLECLKAL
jgi:hypothetical protein